MTIYDELALFQLTDEWAMRDVLANLHQFKDRFVSEFKLQVSDLVIAVEKISHWRLGQYRVGRNGLGLKGEITIAEAHVRECGSRNQWWEVLGTLLHEILHAWQETHGTPSRGNYHNAEFRSKAKQLGLIVNTRGYTQFLAESPFITLLMRSGINVPQLDEPEMMACNKPKGKLKLWVCSCPVRVRVAVKDFHAQCLRCGQPFHSEVRKDTHKSKFYFKAEQARPE